VMGEIMVVVKRGSSFSGHKTGEVVSDGNLLFFICLIFYGWTEKLRWLPLTERREF